jgi:hypothetical protein
METVKHKRDMKTFQEHRERLKNIQPCTDTTTPHSLGLKHLATRPKKQQLIEDRHRVIAMENRQLMERMTKLMVTERKQPKYERHPSLAETGRKLEVDRVNMENNLLLHRLKIVNPVLDREEMERSWKRHLKIGANMRRKQMPSHDHIMDTKKKSPSKTVGSTFDSASYLSQLEGSVAENSAEDGTSGSPIRTMAEFRKHVISSKKLANKNLQETSIGIGGSGIGAVKDKTFEMAHAPR